MYKAKFAWNQNTKFALYQEILKPLLGAAEKGTFGVGGGSKTNTEKDAVVPIILYLDILEDFTYEIKSGFQGYAEAIGSVSSIAGSILDFFSKLNTLSAMGGVSTNAQEYMKMQVWKETEPFRMSLKVALETKTDPFVDVYAPAIALSSMSILSPVNTGNGVTFFTPGINTGNMKYLKPRADQQNPKTKKAGTPDKSKTGQTVEAESDEAKKKRQEDRQSSKIIDVFSLVATRVDGETDNLKYPVTDFDRDSEIPLVVINECFIESAKPTFSQQRTSSGIPIRCDLELTIQSVYSANDAMFAYLKKKDRNNSLITGDGVDLDLLEEQSKIAATNIFR